MKYVNAVWGDMVRIEILGDSAVSLMAHEWLCLKEERDEARDIARALLNALKVIKQDLPDLPIFPENYDEPWLEE